MTADILITKIRAGGSQMVRADTRGAVGHGTWMNVSEHGIDGAINLAREQSAEIEAIADELEKVRAEGVEW